MSTTAIIFRVKRAFLVPLGLLLLSLTLLLLQAWWQGEPGFKLAFLALVMVPIALLFAESACRRVELTAAGITFHKLGRQQSLSWQDLDTVEALKVRKRAFVTLCAGDNCLIISNAYARFPQLINQLLQQAPASAVSDESHNLAAAPPRQSGDIFSCWLGVIVVVLLLILRWWGYQ